MSRIRQEQADQIWALSAVFFAAEGVTALAEKGQWAEENFAVLLPSLARMNCETVRDYYDCPERLAKGRDDLLHYFSHTQPDRRLAYVLQMMRVARRLQGNGELLNVLLKGLQETREYIPHFGMLHENIFARYSAIYQDSASKAAKRIQVFGQANYLRQMEVVNRVRTLLLCGVRAAALWQANGGSRWQLMFGRGGIIALAKELDMGAPYQEKEKY